MYIKNNIIDNSGCSPTFLAGKGKKRRRNRQGTHQAQDRRRLAVIGRIPQTASTHQGASMHTSRCIFEILIAFDFQILITFQFRLGVDRVHVVRGDAEPLRRGAGPPLGDYVRLLRGAANIRGPGSLHLSAFCLRQLALPGQATTHPGTPRLALPQPRYLHLQLLESIGVGPCAISVSCCVCVRAYVVC